MATLAESRGQSAISAEDGPRERLNAQELSHGHGTTIRDQGLSTGVRVEGSSRPSHLDFLFALTHEARKWKAGHRFPAAPA